ncbi:hypothetical protein BRC82_07490 [Halobacteriales archaeon QS_1_67_19]|nr:MAG: hypothetical protein BRC82_07490 [Halobacteriales archaeon QS_1_67_19]
MNKHFEDARYYARRAGTHLVRGLREELQPVERRLRNATGRERSERSRAEQWRTRLTRAEDRAAERAKRAARRARDRV